MANLDWMYHSHLVVKSPSGSWVGSTYRPGIKEVLPASKSNMSIVDYRLLPQGDAIFVPATWCKEPRSQCRCNLFLEYVGKKIHIASTSNSSTSSLPKDVSLTPLISSMCEREIGGAVDRTLWATPSALPHPGTTLPMPLQTAMLLQAKSSSPGAFFFSSFNPFCCCSSACSFSVCEG